jgi:hypothetical protein
VIASTLGVTPPLLGLNGVFLAECRGAEELDLLLRGQLNATVMRVHQFLQCLDRALQPVRPLQE